MFNNVPKDLLMAKIILRLPAVKKRTGLGRSTIYSRIALGKFPRPIRLSERCVGWLEDDIEIWVDQRITEARVERDESL
jgi:prophage regulatory protein